MTTIEVIALSTALAPSIAAMVASFLAYLQGRKNYDTIQEVRKTGDVTHGIVNSQRTKMEEEIKYLRDKGDRLEMLLLKGGLWNQPNPPQA